MKFNPDDPWAKSAHYPTFGEAVRMVRDLKGLSLFDVRDRVAAHGMEPPSRVTMSLVELGRKRDRIGLPIVQKLAAGLGVNMALLEFIFNCDIIGEAYIPEALDPQDRLVFEAMVNLKHAKAKLAQAIGFEDYQTAQEEVDTSPNALRAAKAMIPPKSRRKKKKPPVSEG